MVNKILVLDAGHGGSDPGSIGADIHESAAALITTNQVKDYLEKRYAVDIFMTRTDNQTYPTLAERAQVAVTNNADLFVSIHYNHFDGTAKGYEDLIQELLPTYPKAQASIDLQTAIHTKVVPVLQAYGITDRGKKSGDFQVLRDSYNQCPGIIIEGLFLDNATDAEQFYKVGWQKDFVEAVGEGIATALALPKLTPQTTDFRIEADGLLVAQVDTVDQAAQKVKDFYNSGDVGEVVVQMLEPLPKKTTPYNRPYDFVGKAKADGDGTRSIWFTASYSSDVPPAQVASEVNGGYANVAVKGDGLNLSYTITGAPYGRQIQFEFDFNLFAVGDRDFLVQNLTSLVFTVTPKLGTKYFLKVWNAVSETYELLYSNNGTVGEHSVTLSSVTTSLLKYVSSSGLVRFSIMSADKTVDDASTVKVDFDYVKLVANYNQ